LEGKAIKPTTSIAREQSVARLATDTYDCIIAWKDLQCGGAQLDGRPLYEHAILGHARELVAEVLPAERDVLGSIGNRDGLATGRSGKRQQSDGTVCATCRQAPPTV
jgi:hypothetical protein